MFLDVDGVLNAFDYDPLLAGYTDFVTHEVTVGQQSGFRMIFDLRLSRGMGKALADLPAEITWLTTWQKDADRIVAPLVGLPQGLRVLYPPADTSDSDPVWKFTVLRRTVDADPRPFVWLDDGVNTFATGSVSVREWADELSVPNLLIAPDPRSGLVPGQIEAISEFLTAHG